jgi:hypothetical protein
MALPAAISIDQRLTEISMRFDATSGAGKLVI